MTHSYLVISAKGFKDIRAVLYSLYLLFYIFFKDFSNILFCKMSEEKIQIGLSPSTESPPLYVHSLQMTPFLSDSKRDSDFIYKLTPPSKRSFTRDALSHCRKNLPSNCWMILHHFSTGRKRERYESSLNFLLLPIAVYSVLSASGLYFFCNRDLQLSCQWPLSNTLKHWQNTNVNKWRTNLYIFTTFWRPCKMYTGSFISAIRETHAQRQNFSQKG